ncbi:MAG: hypothetical protein IPN45_15235 [Actinomycetales bacterium]|nr:hypothetical protein [Actinomycetales bacterium]
MISPPQIPGLVYVQPLSQGGYADVYLYEQQSPRMRGRRQGPLKAGSLTDRLKAEVLRRGRSTMAELGDHHHIVQVFRAGSATDGRPYLVMRYCPRLTSRNARVPDVFPSLTCSGSESSWRARSRQTIRPTSSTVTSSPANVLVSAYGAFRV